MVNLVDYFKNIVIRGFGIDRTLLELIRDKDISKAKDLFEDRRKEVEQAIAEYNPETHAIMQRPNKKRKGREDYKTEKLPRSWQEHINEVELFFLLNNPIKWTCEEQDDKGYIAFKDFLTEHRFNSTTRECKRLAGAETHSAKLYHIFQENGKPKVRAQVLSKSNGFDLYPLFNQYEQMIAFGVGYFLKNSNNKTEEYFDIHTPEMIYRCRRASVGWNIEAVNNPTGKINIIYYRQEKAWRSAQPRIERDEMQDSKIADTNNYFADPIAAATADVIKNLADPEQIGKLINLQGKDSDFRYIEPPTSCELRDSEKQTNKEAILADTFTPNFDFKEMLGLGTLSGKAIERIMTVGMIKRNRNIEIYDELIDREKNLIITIIKKVFNQALNFDNLDIKFEFTSPFEEQQNNDSIIRAHGAGLLSTETAVKLLGLVNDSKAEVGRIANEKAEETRNRARLNVFENTAQ